MWTSLSWRGVGLFYFRVLFGGILTFTFDLKICQIHELSWFWRQHLKRILLFYLIIVFFRSMAFQSLFSNEKTFTDITDSRSQTQTFIFLLVDLNRHFHRNILLSNFMRTLNMSIKAFFALVRFFTFVTFKSGRIFLAWYSIRRNHSRLKRKQKLSFQKKLCICFRENA